MPPKTVPLLISARPADVPPLTLTSGGPTHSLASKYSWSVPLDTKPSSSTRTATRTPSARIAAVVVVVFTPMTGPTRKPRESLTTRPFRLGGPSGPGTPGSPCGPGGPCGPGSPGSPRGPSGPWGPASPVPLLKPSSAVLTTRSVFRHAFLILSTPGLFAQTSAPGASGSARSSPRAPTTTANAARREPREAERTSWQLTARTPQAYAIANATSSPFCYKIANGGRG